MNRRNFKQKDAKITPTEFELLVFDYMKEMGKPLSNFSAVHDTIIQAYDGDYQIDIKAVFEAFNCDFSVLVRNITHQ